MDNTQGASFTKLRAEVHVLPTNLVNHNPIGTSAELIDVTVLEGPDESQRKIWILYDSGATDTLVSYSLASFYHSYKEIKNLVSNGVNGAKTYATHAGDLKIIRADGSPLRIKALKSELSSPAFKLKKKTLDIPPHLHQLL